MPRVPGPKDKHSNIPEDTIQVRDVPVETTTEVADLIADAGRWSCDSRWRLDRNADARATLRPQEEDRRPLLGKGGEAHAALHQ